jgi:hypothetical protein
MEAVDLSKLSELEFLRAVSRITKDVNHPTDIAMTQISTMVAVRLKGLEEVSATDLAEIKMRMGPENKSSIIDLELLDAMQGPVTVAFVLTEQVRINALDVEFRLSAEGIKSEDLDIFDDKLREELMDFVGSNFSWDECNEIITDHWFIVNMLGRNPSNELLDRLRQGKLVIQDMYPELLEEVVSDYPLFLENYLAKDWADGMPRDLVDEREGFDS